MSTQIRCAHASLSPTRPAPDFPHRGVGTRPRHRAGVAPVRLACVSTRVQRLSAALACSVLSSSACRPPRCALCVAWRLSASVRAGLLSVSFSPCCACPALSASASSSAHPASAVQCCVASVSASLCWVASSLALHLQHPFAVLRLPALR